MKKYFTLQFKMTSRKLTDFGVNPIIGFCLLSAGFLGFSIYLFSKTEFAEYIFILIALGFASKLSEPKRNDFLKCCFKNAEYRILRWTESLIVISPFIAFLIYEKLFLSTVILTAITLLMRLVNFGRTLNYTIPTPFYKQPFEFIVGFRSTFPLFFFAYFLTFMGVLFGNFNLGAFSLLLVFFISLSFYSKLENEYYVWAFNDTPKGFIIKKIKTGIVYSSILVAPILIVLSIFFFNEIFTLLTALLLGYVYLVTIILAKYSAYPYEINLLQILVIGISFIFPPLLIGIIPYFYFQTKNRLYDIFV